MEIISLQKGRVLKLYPGVLYEFDLVGGYGYAILMKKYEVERDEMAGNLLLILPGIHEVRPERLDKVLKPLLQTGSDVYYMMFFPVEMGLRRGLFRAIGIIREIDSWFTPNLPVESDSRRTPWYWSSVDDTWSFMPSGVSQLDGYSVSSIALLRLLKGLDIVQVKAKKEKIGKGRPKRKIERI